MNLRGDAEQEYFIERIMEFLTRVLFFFFFQAEDGIRDRNVTGVQTCALPICSESVLPALFRNPVGGGAEEGRKHGLAANRVADRVLEAELQPVHAERACQQIGDRKSVV